jgi:hypothetical protein
MFLLADMATSAFGWALAGLGVIALIAAFVYLGGPLLIYFTHKQAARPNLVAFKPGVTPLPADVDQYFHATSWALAQQGFEVVTGMFLPGQVEGVVAALIFLVNRQEQDAAIAVTLHQQTPGMSTTLFHCEFVTRYRDGRVVQTNNAQPLNAFPIPARCTNSYLPSVCDPVDLYRLHQALCRQRQAGPKVLLLDERYGGDAVRYVADSIIEELEEATSAGVMRLDEAGGVYRPTLKGAVRMTYGELWPTKGFRLRRRARRERELLADLAYDASKKPATPRYSAP